MTTIQQAPASVRFDRVDRVTLPDEQLRRVAVLVSAYQQEPVPDDPVVPLDVVARRLRVVDGNIERTDFVAWQGANALGFAASIRWKVENNQHIRELFGFVAPEHRRRGVGRALFAAIVRTCGERDDLLFDAFTNDRVPAGAAFAERFGGKRGLENHMNQLELASLDRALVAEWARLDPSGYRLAWIDRDIPDALMANVISAYDAMNHAPRGDLKFDDWKTEPEQVREWDRIRNANGRERRLGLAIDEASGETAGYTEVVYDPQRPHVISQQGTAVIPAHRGRGLGKWVKAAMLERAVADWPAARYVRTGNADQNAPMLAINTRLGFRPVWASTHWQTKIVDARAALAR